MTHHPQNCRSCTQPEVAFAHHDHSACEGDILQRASALTAAGGARMTPVRQRVLEILLEQHRAVGAYEVLKRLGEEGFGNQPPVAYRALEFLVDQGLAHRIQRLNAFAACMHPGESHSPVFLICRLCHAVAETAGTRLRAQLADEAQEIGFRVERTTIEALGLCPNCRHQPSAEGAGA